MGLLKKITGGAKKLVRKVVPKEVAGIMTAAAPFVAPYSLPAAAALSIGGQLRTGQGRINPILTGMSLLPGIRFQGGQGLGAFKPTGFTRFGPNNFGSGITSRQLLFGGPGAGQSGKLGAFGDKAEGFLFGNPELQAMGNEADGMLSLKDPTQGLLGFGGEYGTGGSLISTMKNGAPVISKTKIGAAAAAGLTLSQTQEQIANEGEELGLGDSQLAALQAEAAEMWEDFDTTQFKPNVKDGGLMRINLRKGSGDELPPDPTKPVNPFAPKPTGPVLPDKKMAMSYGYNDAMSDTYDLFLQMKRDKEIPIDMEFDIFLLEVVPEMSKGKKEGNTMMAANGGLMRTNYALGSMPTNEESGLGGLPIEADMRYSGGFMPYGEKEKADDVPARLSKNEFVFTADAVRAAGGGSIQKGAQKMYNSMKQLESMGRSVA